MSQSEAYMLARDSKESKRLDFQHEFMRHLGHGNLLHPSIPRDEVRAVADIGTGTGVWISEIAEDFQAPSAQESGKLKFVGFDISPQQFPDSANRVPGIDFVVHDVTTQFPNKYHGVFDLVNVRFMSYALKAQDLKTALESIVELLRPGGYLHWQEIDIVDVWATPSTPNVRDAITHVVLEKVARGLIHPFPIKIVKAILSLSTATPTIDGTSSVTEPAGKLNPITWTNDLLRISSLETISTQQHPSSKVQAEKNIVGLAVNTQLLLSAAVRKRALAEESQTTEEDKQDLLREAQANENIVKAIGKEITDGITTWDADMTWIVARKAVLVAQDEDWMTARHRCSEFQSLS